MVLGIIGYILYLIVIGCICTCSQYLLITLRPSNSGLIFILIDSHLIRRILQFSNHLIVFMFFELHFIIWDVACTWIGGPPLPLLEWSTCILHWHYDIIFLFTPCKTLLHIQILLVKQVLCMKFVTESVVCISHVLTWICCLLIRVKIGLIIVDVISWWIDWLWQT